ncbi:ECF transporter S component [Caldicellulosiruptor naganoensis]|uniref:ECF transporter S component n=1 Tax=Caldicellulosiruptor naganoensis TaxID=29324 RepID=A0ABY7BN05_9FIRM|nr:ECF transporter S component [Caldicellulosiruptor naganoensis]WAM32401.1 ECF transporter S component [Caldicellulosiruptor naganoensis]
MGRNTKFWIFAGLLAAAVFVLTFAIKIPLLTGYFNIGDVIIMIASILFGKGIGFLAGSFGSALADLAAGYLIYAPFTFIIKGLEGYFCGLIFEKLGKDKKQNLGFIISSVVSGIWMAVGYFLAEGFVLKYLSSALNVNRDLQFGFKTALVNFPFNLLQGILSAVVAVILIVPLYKNKFIGKMRV